MFQLRENFEACLPAGELKKLEGLRVLHVGKFYPPHPGGMETHLQSLCGELKRFVEVEVVVAGDERKTRVEVIDRVKVTRAGTVVNLGSTPVCPEMARIIRETNAEIVHIHHPNPVAILAYLASGHRGRLVLTYHSDIIRQRVLSRAFGPMLRRALDRADAIIVTSPNYINSSPVLPAYRERCRVIPFGISLDQFQRTDAAKVAQIRQLYGPRLVLGVGRLVYYKGFEYLIRAMSRVQGRLVIVGNGPLRQKLQQEAQAHGVSERVTFLTDVEDVCPYYQAADVFALPSIARSEAFGIVQLEAMACGTPVVNTQLDSGVTFVSPHEVSGLTVPPANAEALGQAINALLDDPLRRARYGDAGQRRVERKFNLEVMLRRTVGLYQEVMTANARRAS